MSSTGGDITQAKRAHVGSYGVHDATALQEHRSMQALKYCIRC